MADPFGLSIKPHNDFHLDASGNLAVVTGPEAIAEHIRQRLLFWNGEWFLDRGAGVEWTRYVLGRPSTEQPIAEAVIKAEILATPGVAEILTFDAEFDRASRGLRVLRCEVLTVYDDVLELQI